MPIASTRQPVGKMLLFGATGDLSQRMLLPSLCNLHADGLLPDGLTITATSRSEYDDPGFRAFAQDALKKFLPEERKDQAALDGFLDRLSYLTLDVGDESGFKALGEKVGDVSGGHDLPSSA